MLIVCEDQELKQMRSSVIGLVTQIIVIRRNSNGFKTPLPLPLILLPLPLKCKAAPKMQHSNCCQRKSRTLFSMAEVVKLDNTVFCCVQTSKHEWNSGKNCFILVDDIFRAMTHQVQYMAIWCTTTRRSGQSVTASDFGSNGPRFESGRGRCVESLDKALYSHCPKEKPSH